MEKVVNDKKTGRFVKKSIAKWKSNVSRGKKHSCQVEAHRKLHEARARTSAGNVTSTMRRIVELKELAKELWCGKCDAALSLRDMDPSSMRQRGLAAVFSVKCLKCTAVYVVHSAKRHWNDSKNCYIYDMNYKLSLGCMDTPFGGDQVNAFLTALNIPVFPKSLLKRCDRKVGPAVEAVAKQSCAESILLEKSLTIELQKTTDKRKSFEQAESHFASESVLDFNETNSQVFSSTPAPISQVLQETHDEADCQIDETTQVAETPKRRLPPDMHTLPPAKKVSLIGSIDAGWQKRGTGRAYNSLSGHASLIGHMSGKILDFGVKCKSCTLCTKGHDPEDHDCRKNHTGSAKAMEPALAVELCTNNPLLEAADVVIGTLIGDGDSSCVQAVRRESSVPVTKWLDLNHVRKGFSNSLYSHNLPDNVRTYLCSSFAYAISTNKGDPEAVKAAIMNIVKHAYGEHEYCGSWCTYSDDPENYRHKGLPGGKPLTSVELKATLLKILSRYAENCDKIAPCSSSQGNESFNNLVASKNPKSKFNSGSESLSYRVAAAVGQKNIGTSYVVKVNKKMGLSPGNITEKYRSIQDKYRSMRSRYQKTREFKCKRMLWKRKRMGKAAAEERTEGVTYASECELGGIAELVDDPNVVNHKLSVTGALPVFVDLETTGRSKITCEILQLAAKVGQHEYSAYILPQRKIPQAATAINGLTAEGGELFWNGKQVRTTPPRLALSGFIDFLKSLDRHVVLAAHNGSRFDHPIILRDIRKFGLLPEFLEVVAGFVDTLDVFRGKLPERVRTHQSFSQSALAADYQINNPAAHNAIGDVAVLEQLVSTLGLVPSEVLHHSKSVLCVVQKEDRLALKSIFNEEMKCLAPTLTKSMISKIAAAGISLQRLQTTFTTGGEEALIFLLSQDVNGKPNVTRMKNKLKEIVTAAQSSLTTST